VKFFEEKEQSEFHQGYLKVRPFTTISRIFPANISVRSTHVSKKQSIRRNFILFILNDDFEIGDTCNAKKDGLE